ncbi:beta strand repeat-containing protein [Halomonas hibernica]|uniref:beta strand repeat-containing protein n=1 Tax=Halomonas hibernica TaxID=2591147 RepID=UPI001555A485|nr:hypothetical protein [Halomonas hibernica]
MALQGFDKTYYLNAKLAQLQSDSATASSWAGKTVAFLEERLQDGFGLTAEQHYEQFGYNEGLAPNAFFNAAEYIRAKAVDMFNDPATTYLTVDAAAQDFVSLWPGNVYDHYLQYGNAEGINPSNAFDVSDYYEAKLAELQAAGNTEITTVAEVKAAFEASGLTALGHFIEFGREEGLTAPAVPADEQVTVDNAVPGETFNLTTGIDNLVGTNGDDTFNAVENATTGRVLGALDVINGGAGNDTLNVSDTISATGDQFTLPTGLTVENVENFNLTTNGGVNVDVSGFTGLESVETVAAGTAATAVTAAGTSNVTTAVTGAATTTINGGKDVSVTAGAGAVAITGAALENVTVKGGNVSAANAIDNTATGTTLKSVTLNDVNGTDAKIRGEAVDTLTLQNQDTALAATITNTASKALTVNLNNVGYQADGSAIAGNVVVNAGAAAETITLNATGAKSAVTVTGAAGKAVNITGDAALTLVPLAATFTAIDGSAATGNLTLGALNTATTSVKTGAGNDTFTLGAAKVNVDAGAGNDVVTLNGAIAAGSTIKLGAGDDKLLVSAAGTGSVAASTKEAVTVIDGGEGFNTVSATLINAGNAAQFVNFQALDLSVANVGGGTLDLDLVSGIETLALSGGTGGSAVSNVAAGVGLTVAGNNTGTTTIGVKGAATNTSDSFGITFAGTDVAGAAATAANVNAGTVVTDGVETLNIVSAGGNNTWNSITVADDKLQTLNITGDKALTLAFDATATTGTNAAAGGGAVKLIDGSAATGNLSINTENVTADNSATGLTVKGGAGNDFITLDQKATVEGGAGNDTIVSSAAGGNFTGGAGNDTFNVSAATATGTTEATSVLTTITDFSAGDKIVFGANASDDFNGQQVVLDTTVQNLDQALAQVGAVNDANETSWFQYAGNTYIVADTDAAGSGTFNIGDTVVQLTGLVDLSSGTITNGELSLA